MFSRSSSIRAACVIGNAGLTLLYPVWRKNCIAAGVAEPVPPVVLGGVVVLGTTEEITLPLCLALLLTVVYFLICYLLQEGPGVSIIHYPLPSCCSSWPHGIS